MKKIISAGVAAAALLVAAPAFSADLAKSYPVKAPVLVAEPVFSWTGFYIGGNAGGAWGSVDGDAGILDMSPSGFIGGGQIGYNVQLDNNVVVGIEADFQGSDVSDTSFGIQSKLDYFGTVRGRVGYAFDHILPYFTGGFAWGHNKVTDQFTGFETSNTLTGWTVGGGVEYALTNNWTVKAEYLYMDLGDDYYDSIGANSGLTASVVRAGINYKF